MSQGQHAGHPTYWRSDGTGPRPAVLIHCSLAHSGAWSGVMACLKDTHQMTAFDMPGHGRSAPYVGSDYQGLTARIGASFCDGPTHVIGHSFGATVALRLAADHPALVSRLSLIDPVFFAAADPQMQANHAAEMVPFAELMDRGDHTNAAAFFNSLWGATNWADVPAAQQDYMAQRIHLIPLASASITGDPHGMLAGKLARLTGPVDLIAGACSPPIIASILDGLHACMPQARRITIAGAGHMAPLTHPREVAQALTD